jgi:hypothetical protein
VIDPDNWLTLEQIIEDLLTSGFVNIHCLALKGSFWYLNNLNDVFIPYIHKSMPGVEI